MTNKTKVDGVLNKAEALLADIQAASRGVRLRKAEAEVKAAASTPAARRSRLHRAESEVEASAPHDQRCIYVTMKPAKQKPEKPVHPAARALALARRR